MKRRLRWHNLRGFTAKCKALVLSEQTGSLAEGQKEERVERKRTSSWSKAQQLIGETWWRECHGSGIYDCHWNCLRCLDWSCDCCRQQQDEFRSIEKHLICFYLNKRPKTHGTTLQLVAGQSSRDTAKTTKEYFRARSRLARSSTHVNPTEHVLLAKDKTEDKNIPKQTGTEVGWRTG